MKKTLKTIFVLTLATTLAAFAPPVEKKEVKKSSITWLGKKVTGEHSGTVNLKSGYLNMDGDKITAGSFVIDMTSLAVTDLQGEYKANLEGHLSSEDFFGTANHPTATFTISKAKKDGMTYKVAGDITIKGVTQPLTFDLHMKDNKAHAKLVIDRTKFGITYGSGSFFDDLKDKAIYDDFELDVNLEF